MTTGDRAEEVAIGENESAFVKGAEYEKEKTAVENLTAKRAAEFLDNTHMVLLFAFMDKNPGVGLEVIDCKSPGGQTGTLVSRDGSIRVAVGKNLVGIDRHHNDMRYRFTPESARLVSEFEIQREIRQVEVDSRARVMHAWSPEPVEKSEIKDDLTDKFRTILFRILQGSRNFAYATRENGSRSGGVVSLSYKCEKKDALLLLELAKNAGVLEERDGGAMGFKFDDDSKEMDWAELLGWRGFQGEKCMPIGVKIDEDCKFIKVFPKVESGDK